MLIIRGPECAEVSGGWESVGGWGDAGGGMGLRLWEMEW